MTSRERVKAALTFTGPDRPPRDMWVVSHISLFRNDELEAVREAFPMDICTPRISTEALGDAEQQQAQAGSYVDEWGVTWETGEAGVVGEVKHPILADWAGLASFQPPWHLLCDVDWGHVNRQCEKSDKFMLSEETAFTFERLQFLRGTEDLFIDIAYDTKEFRQLLEIVNAFYRKNVTAWSETAVDGVFLSDDWGTNRALLINPDTWRAVFKPIYREYCDIIHANGKFAFFHSDGNIAAIYEDLIEVGFDAINSQLFLMDMDELASKYKGRVTFWGEIDSQHILPFGTPDDVRAAVQRVRRTFDDGTGGVIAQCTWNKGHPRANMEAVYTEWEKSSAE